MSDYYLTIQEKSEGLYKEKMSKFISFAIPINSADEAKEHIKTFQKDYFDARHVCWAYMLGAARNEFQSNDNGEPSGTAGKPILGQINSNNLTNILIIVVRYFGGIKLGTSGLIVAYREAAADAIANAKIIECHEQSIVKFNFPYIYLNDVMKIIKADNITVISQIFDNNCYMEITINSDDATLFSNKIENIDGTSIL
ncbi:MAG: YigZ family protein [Muribaculaceae bacterium]|nr:YigZ family protein [Muribaculaceae bacterium]